MKKIIAMVLCVALIAALGVSAFAETKTGRHSYAYYWNKLVDDAVTWKGDIREYAAGLANAKKAYGDAKDAYNKAMGALANAQTTFIYDSLADFYDAALWVANVQFNNALEEAQANFQYELYKSIDSDFVGWIIPETYTAEDVNGNEVTLYNSTNWEQFNNTWTEKGWN